MKIDKSGKFKDVTREDQVLFTGCALVTEELIMAGIIKDEYIELAMETLRNYRSMITEPDLIDAFEDSRESSKPKYGQ